MNKFEEAFISFLSECYRKNELTPHDVKEIKRVFYAGAITLLGLFENTSDDPHQQEQEVIEISDEVMTWVASETDIINKEVRALKKRWGHVE